MRKHSVRLCVEVLEDRSLPSTLPTVPAHVVHPVHPVVKPHHAVTLPTFVFSGFGAVDHGLSVPGVRGFNAIDPGLSVPGVRGFNSVDPGLSVSLFFSHFNDPGLSIPGFSGGTTVNGRTTFSGF